MKVGESFTLGILLSDNYAIPDAEEIKIYIGGQIQPHTLEDRMIRCEITSDTTSKWYGKKEIDFWLDDINWGVRKYSLGNIIFTNIPAPDHNESINTGYDVIISLSIAETSITISDIMYSYVKGDSSFQVWQQIPGNEGKTWEDFVTFMQEPAAEATQAALDAAFTASLATTASLSATTSSILATESASFVTQASILATESSSIATQNAIIATSSASLATQNTIEAINSASIATVSASNAAALATEVAEHPDKIVEDYWWKWNIGTKEYEDTGIKAKGDVQYTTFYLDSETGILSQTFDTDLQNTTFSLVSGSLILEINNT